MVARLLSSHHETDLTKQKHLQKPVKVTLTGDLIVDDSNRSYSEHTL